MKTYIESNPLFTKSQFSFHEEQDFFKELYDEKIITMDKGYNLNYFKYTEFVPPVPKYDKYEMDKCKIYFDPNLTWCFKLVKTERMSKSKYETILNYKKHIKEGYAIKIHDLPPVDSAFIHSHVIKGVLTKYLNTYPDDDTHRSLFVTLEDFENLEIAI